MTDTITLGYLKIRGLGQVARLLLAYTGLEWKDVQYATGDEFVKTDRKELGLSFPNLPYLVDGDFKVTESKAISQYIIKRSGKVELLGKNLRDQTLVECLLGVLQDSSLPIFSLFRDKTAKVEPAVEKSTPKLEQLAAFYGEKDFALGYLTLADFAINEFAYYLEKTSPETFEKFGFLKRLRAAFEGLPEIKKYYEQESALKGPFLPSFAAIPF